MRTGQLVVRHQSPWRRRALRSSAVLGGLLLLYLIYEWGRFEGGYSKFAEIQRRRELAAQIEALEQENEKLRGDIAVGGAGAQRRQQGVRATWRRISPTCRRRCSSIARS